MSLIEKALTTPEPLDGRSRTWESILKEKDPVLYREVLEVVREYHAGKLAHRFKSTNALARFLQRELSGKVRATSVQTFYRFIREVYDGRAVEESVRKQCEREVAAGAGERSPAKAGRNARKKA
jgi:hypothetical protein